MQKRTHNSEIDNSSQHRYFDMVDEMELEEMDLYDDNNYGHKNRAKRQQSRRNNNARRLIEKYQEDKALRESLDDQLF